jgi:polysaccharide biosynthesis protein PslH
VDAAAPPPQFAPALLTKIRRRVAKVRRTRHAIATLKQTFHDLLGTGAYDLVLIHGTRIYDAIDPPHAVPVVFDMCDASSARLRHGLGHGPIAQLPWRLFRYWQIQRIEAGVTDRTPHVVFISERDREAVMGSRPGARIIPNGVDLDYWRRERDEKQDGCLVFTGVLDYPPNADAALHLLERVLPEIRRAVPNVELVVAGRNPLPALFRAARRLDVTVTGYVPDLRPYLERATVYVAPLRFASGMQNKLLEAMAMELPVVTTAVAADGLRYQGDEPPVLVGRSPEELAQHVIALLDDVNARRRLGAMGRDFVTRHFDWEHSAMLLERLCLEAVVSNGDPSTHGRANDGANGVAREGIRAALLASPP